MRLSELGFSVLSPLLSRMDAERAHRLVLLLGRHGHRLLPIDLPEVPTRIGRRIWRRPVGLAAGADKDALALPLWPKLGFGSIEIGTVLPRPQAGNPRPRVHRISEHRAIVNAMGFPSAGMDQVLENLRGWSDSGHHPDVPVGINVSKNKETPADRAALDCAAVARTLRPFADWVTVNVSSPNTPGLRDLQASAAIRRLVEAVGEEVSVPIYVKLSPDLDEDGIEEASEAAERAGAHGLVVSNTTIRRPLPEDHRARELPGGLSGRPLWEFSRRAVEIAAQAGRLPVIAAGGIDSAERALSMLSAGASAVQLYTGLVYEGPRLLREISFAASRATVPPAELR